MTEKYEISDYLKIEKIGEGTYGVVYRGKNKKTNEFVALKKIRMENEEQGVPATALREIAVLKQLSHANIVRLEQVLIQVGKLYLVFEYCSCDLRKLLDTYKARRTPLSGRLIQNISYQMLQGLLFCHQRRVIHRDLKPHNILIDELAEGGGSGTVKLADFGLARAFSLPLRPLTHEVVTLWYRAPEILLGAAVYTTAVDVWSMACIMLEVATLRPYFQGDSEIDQLFSIFRVMGTPHEQSWPGVTQLRAYKSEFPKWESGQLRTKLKPLIQEDFIELIEKMLIYSPEERYHVQACLLHSYFACLDKSSVPAANLENQKLW